jgi:hypothetical protein
LFCWLFFPFPAAPADCLLVTRPCFTPLAIAGVFLAAAPVNFTAGFDGVVVAGFFAVPLTTDAGLGAMAAGAGFGVAAGVLWLMVEAIVRSALCVYSLTPSFSISTAISQR